MSNLSKLDRLMFTIGVNDAASGPVGKIMNQVQRLTNVTKSGLNDIGYGAAGLAGTGLLVANSMAPAIDANAALGEVASLNVADDALLKLNNTALDFVSNFGGNVPEVIRSAYDIQSSISGLQADELSAFTKASNILAVATKADAAVITDFMGTMHGIFEDTAVKIGRANWVEQLAGQTAKAVQLFKTDGPKMAQAFSTLGADAANLYKIPMNEQIAVMGQLQATMSGSESGTKYKAFLAGIAKAQDKLGLSFTDQSGTLLPMVDILEKIKDRTSGITNDVELGNVLFQAFGSKEAVALISGLLPKTEQLRQNVEILGDQSGMETALEMANKISNPWKRLSGSINEVTTAVGQGLSPVLDPLVDMLASGISRVARFAVEFPVLSGYLTGSIATVLGVMAAMSALSIVLGIYKITTAGASAGALLFGQGLKVLKGTMWLLSHATKILTLHQVLFSSATFIVNKVMVFARATMLAYQLSLVATGSTLGVIRLASVAFTRSLWAMNAALIFNPIGLVVIAVAALGYGLYKAFQETNNVTDAFTQWADNSLIIQVLKLSVDVLFVALKGIWSVIKSIGRVIADVFGGLLKFIDPILQKLKAFSDWAAGGLKGFLDGGGFSGVFKSEEALSVNTAVPGVSNNIPDNVIPFPQVSASSVSEQINNSQRELNGSLSSIDASRSVQRSNFIQQQVSNASNQNENRSVHIETVQIKTDKADDPNILANVWENVG